MAKPPPIKDRIKSAMGGRGSAQYHEIMEATFPSDLFPNSFRGATKGGPPGCARAFGRALDRYGYTTNGKIGRERIIFSPTGMKERK